MKDLQMLIKPVSGACNMRCAYCFYADEMKNREAPCLGRMDERTAHALIDRALQEAERSVTFAFQGGEPTLAGLPFYEGFVRRVGVRNTKRLAVRYVLQTNGLLLDDAWIAFFKRHAFLVGLSLDGPKDVHDRFRETNEGKSGFARTMRAAQRMLRAGVPFNILCVLTGESARAIGRTYSFYMRNGFSYQQYIPCLNPLGCAGTGGFALTSEAYARALCMLFDAYYADMAQGRYVYIRQFENYAGLLRGCEPESCAMSGRCGIQFVIEADGSVFPCDFYALDAWRLGNVAGDSLSTLAQGEAARAFLHAGDVREAACRICRYFPLCRGGCRRECGDGLHGGTNLYCGAYKAFFAYALPRLELLLQG